MLLPARCACDESAVMFRAAASAAASTAFASVARTRYPRPRSTASPVHRRSGTRNIPTYTRAMPFSRAWSALSMFMRFTSCAPERPRAGRHPPGVPVGDDGPVLHRPRPAELDDREDEPRVGVELRVGLHHRGGGVVEGALPEDEIRSLASEIQGHVLLVDEVTHLENAEEHDHQ